MQHPRQNMPPGGGLARSFSLSRHDPPDTWVAPTRARSPDSVPGFAALTEIGRWTGFAAQ